MLSSLLALLAGFIVVPILFLFVAYFGCVSVQMMFDGSVGLGLKIHMVLGMMAAFAVTSLLLVWCLSFIFRVLG